MHFLLILGPPAAGKMTVAQAVCKKTGFKMFHNHQSIEVGLSIFNYGDVEFGNINEGIRQLVFKQVAQSKLLKGFIFTLVMGFELTEDWEYMKSLEQQFVSQGWQFHIAELESDQEIRLSRNSTNNRLDHKPSKRDIELSSNNLIRMDKMHRMNSTIDELTEYSYVRINNNLKTPDEVADIIIHYFGFHNLED